MKNKTSRIFVIGFIVATCLLTLSASVYAAKKSPAKPGVPVDFKEKPTKIKGKGKLFAKFIVSVDLKEMPDDPKNVVVVVWLPKPKKVVEIGKVDPNLGKYDSNLGKYDPNYNKFVRFFLTPIIKLIKRDLRIFFPHSGHD